MPTPLLELRVVDKRFGITRALGGASLAVRAGSVHPVLGENGAGKTTLVAVADRRVVAYDGTFRPASHDRDLAGRAIIGAA